MARYTGPSKPCHDCAESGKQVEATENLGMRLTGPNGERKLGLFCKGCADYRTGKGPKFSWSQLGNKESTPAATRNDSFAAGHKKSEPEESFYQPSMFDE